MTDKKITSFLNFQKQFQKSPKEEKKENYKDFSFDSFFKITPSWQSKKNYAIIQIRSREFKLFKRGCLNLNWLTQYFLQLSLYVNPEDYNEKIQDMLNYAYDNKGDFKEQMDRRLEVY